MGFCYETLAKIINLSITGSIAILAVLLLRFLLCKAPRRFSYLLWGIVLFRLLCPVSFVSSVSLWNLSDGIATPLVFGLLRPKTYLSPGLGEQEQDYIILHEQYHIFRRDYLFRPMAFAALCLHWFNPLVWLAFALSGKDMEMSCDEAVMRKAGRDIRSEYARSLLVLTVGKGRMPGVPLAFGEGDTKSRIKNVMNYKRPGFVILAVAAFACVIGAICLIANPAVSVSDKISPESGAESAGIISGTNENAFPFSQQQITPEEEKVIQEEIIKSNDSGYPEEYDICCCNFVNLKKVVSERDGIQTATYYGWSYYEEYKYGEGGLETVSGSYVPEALTFRIDEDGYHLEEYWTPGDGDDYYTDIQKKFPGDIVKDALDSEKFVLQQVRDCYAQAISHGNIDTDPIIERLLNEICAGMPNESSNPQDYIDAHDWECRELSFYGSYTVSYCVSRFEAGMETGLEGQVMARIMEELLGTKGKLSPNAGQASNGQEWYDSLKNDAPEILKGYIVQEKEPALFSEYFAIVQFDATHSSEIILDATGNCLQWKLLFPILG